MGNIVTGTEACRRVRGYVPGRVSPYPWQFPENLQHDVEYCVSALVLTNVPTPRFLCSPKVTGYDLNDRGLDLG